jgi:hypothetical protein
VCVYVSLQLETVCNNLPRHWHAYVLKPGPVKVSCAQVPVISDSVVRKLCVIEE